VITYLNPEWGAADGGELRIYTAGENPEPYRDVPPHAGTLVCLLSDTVYHEVLAPRRERLSLTGWFRRR
jgi:SM-20-related protein